jgi:hypothetical protein
VRVPVQIPDRFFDTANSTRPFIGKTKEGMFDTDYIEKQLKYSVGQPMGALSS